MPPAPPTRPADGPLAHVRRVCLALPEASERLSHGHPAFFVREKRCFVMYLDDHHADGRLALWCAAPLGAQDELVETAPERYFVPPYVGYRGWIGLRLDRDASDGEVAAVIEDAYVCVAPVRLADEVRARR